jgi:Cdc6-like AAA superfamily ATPase
MARAISPKDDKDWAALRAEVLDIFTPGAPIDEVALFAGRQDHLQRLRDVVVSKGRHAVVYGERGTGKTSLANIFHLGQFKPRDVAYVYVQCNESDSFDAMWRKALRRVAFHGDTREIQGHEMILGDATPDEIEVVLANFGPSVVPIIVFDEFDRIRDDAAKSLMSATIKQLSNSASVHATIILVGVANNVTQLIQAHASSVRALVQIRIPRMSRKELQEIVVSRLRMTPLKINDAALWRVAYLSSGLPFYAHALGQSASLLAIEKRVLMISEDIVRDAIQGCFDDVDQTLVDSFVKAIVETRKGNLFKFVAAACALAEQDELGRFSAVDVQHPLSSILIEEMDASKFTFHLNELCTAERGAVLGREGTRGSYRYRFVQPIIQPFIIMKSLASGVLPSHVLDRFAIERQRKLPI